MLSASISIGIYVILLCVIAFRFKEIRESKLERTQILYGHQYGSLQDQINVSIKLLGLLIILNLLTLVPFVVIRVTQLREIIPTMSRIHVMMKELIMIINVWICVPWGFYLFSEIKHTSKKDGLQASINGDMQMIRYYRHISLIGVVFFITTAYQAYQILIYYQGLLILSSIIITFIIWCGMADVVLDDNYNSSIGRTKLTGVKATIKNILRLRKKEFFKEKISVVNKNIYNIIQGIKGFFEYYRRIAK